MDALVEESSKIIATLGNLFKRDGLIPEFEVLSLYPVSTSTYCDRIRERKCMEDISSTAVSA